MMISLQEKVTNAFLKSNTIKALMVLVVGFVGCNNVNAQVSSYNVTAIPNAFAPLPSPAGGVNKIALSSTVTATEDAIYPLALPFVFTFNGITYPAASNINVSLNGFITFGSTAPTAANVTPISSNEGYAGAIALYGRDLDLIAPTTTNNVSYIITGTAPNRILKIDWLVRRSTGATSGLDGNNLPFQLWLYETTNVVEMHYGTFNPSSTTPTFGQIGLRGTTNSDFKNFVYTTAADWPATLMTLGAVNTDAVRLRQTPGQIAAGSVRSIRWTPDLCPSPSSVTISNIAINTADVNFVAPSTPPSNGYVYEVRTSGAAGSGAVGLAQSGATPSNPFTLSGLAAGTTYTVFIRSFCGGATYGSWVSSGSFTTLCNATFPYFEYIDPFTGFSVPNLPPCTSRQNAGLGNNWVSTNPAPSMFDEHMIYNFSFANAANAWFYTGGVNLIAGNEYRISYTYGGSSQFTFITNKMEVKYGTAPVNTAMTIPIDNHPVIKTSPFQNVVNFTAPSTGVFYFGFRAYSDANNGELYLDDIEIVNSSCRKPTGVTAPPALISFNSALVSWTAPSPAPGSGYTYFLSTVNPVKNAGAFVIGNTYVITTLGTTNYTTIGAPSNTIGTTFIATGLGTGTGTATELLGNSTAPTGSVSAGSTILNLNGLTPSTTYYIWVRGNCSAGDFSQWSDYISFTTNAAPPTYCLPSGLGNPQDPNGITNVTMGTINNTTGIEVNNYGNYSSLSTNVAQGATIPVSITFGTGFTYDTNIWVDWNNDGDFDDAGESVYTGVSAAPNPSTLNASFVVPLTQPLGPRRLRIGSIDSPTFTGGALTPCRVGSYQAFEDYSINVVVAPPPLSLNISTSTQCAGTASPLVTVNPSALTDFQTFSWTPSTGVSGTAASGFTFTNSSNTTYILTANQTGGAFSTNSASFTYVANDVPTPITITTPSGTLMCPQGPGIPLVASGGVVSNVSIFTENFNSGIGAWTTTNTSSGGANTAAPAWNALPSGSVVSFQALTSNDNSQFIVSNSDAQGGTPAPSVTRTSITSPPINLTGYQTASLSFYQYLNWIAASDVAVVEVTTNAGATWTTLATYTADQGSATNFSLAIINLNTYAIAGNTIQVRFRYQSNWGWWWAIDNFRVSGSATSAIVWSPTTGLFNDAAGNIPYTGTGASTVYALSSTPQTYTATASTPGPTICTATNTISLTVSPIVAGTATGNQTICYGAPSNLTLSGNIGTITGWQYSANLAFTTPVAIPASASATLTSAQMGNLFATRYYRAVVTNGSCTSYSNVITVTYDSTTWDGSVWSDGFPSATKTAIFDGDYTSTGDLNACSVYISSGDVTFLGGHSLIVQNIVDTSGGTLTFENNSSLVQVVNGITNVGNITYRRNTTPVRKFDYTYWSSPVAPQTLVGLSPLTLFDKYFSFNPAINNWVSEAGTNLMVAGKGYIIRSPNNFDPITPSIFNGQFFGTPNNGVISTPIVIGAADVNLIGNPYPSALNIDSFFDFNGITTGTGVIEKTIYLWTHNTIVTNNNYVNSDYAVYNYMGGIGTTGAPGANNAVPNGRVASGQSFFIKGLLNGNAVFNNSMRVIGNNNQFFRYNNQATAVNSGNKSRVWLEVYNNQGAYKQTMVGYAGGATNDYDSGYDGEILDSGSTVNFYSTLGIKKLAIQGRGLPFNENDIVPLGFKSTIAGSYEIKLSNFDGIFDTQKVYLEDKLLNVIHNIKLSNYSFTTNAGSFDDRFALRFTDSALQVDDQLFAEESVVIFKENQSINITSSLTPMKSVQIFDIRGSLIYSNDKVNAVEHKITNLHSSQQVLLVKVVSDNGTIVTKKILF
ncbi:T9SS sorting signal type C domain-containing protein [Flavobacterium sp.]|uniref:T9SS sorting signal type C domain-containing protein n=1 Tax=Flavobacterium sp. TaxID=239 RepID=UPI0026023964|nr:T9SS sorting signal type C domain-containing protein [Flavobacterium sp.]